MSDPTLLTALFQGQLFEFGIDGVFQKSLQLSQVSDAVWSSGGVLALVQGGRIWVGSPGKLRRLTRGHAPSWSPGGKQIVFERRSWVMIARLRGGSVRRLVKGTAPAWSPDGRWIAFFDTRHRLSVVRAGGGAVRRVGKVTGRTVDWQPLPAKRSAPCLAPPGSAVAASGDTAIVTYDRAQFADAFAAMGCLRADGRQRVLAAFLPSSSSLPSEAAVAGDYAALVFIGSCGRYEESRWSATVKLFNLRAGAQIPDRGGESAVGPLYEPENISTCGSSMDQLVLGSDAVSAVHVDLKGQDVNGNGCNCTVEQMQASDSTGVHALDSVTEPDGSSPALTNLTLTGDTLTWQHNGTPRSAQLQR